MTIHPAEIKAAGTAITINPDKWTGKGEEFSELMLHIPFFAPKPHTPKPYGALAKNRLRLATKES